MNLRLILVVPILVALSAISWGVRADAQNDTLDERVAALETQVADLSTRVAGLEAAASTPSPEAVHTMHGSFTVYDFFTKTGQTPVDNGSMCGGSGLYAEYVRGAEVTVTDGTGKVIAVTHLGPGTVQNARGTEYGGDCVFMFTLTDVPTTDSYTFHIASYEFGTISYTNLASHGWIIQLSFK